MRRAVLAAGAELRALPWRAVRDPWAVLVSELMLQQTQARRVVEPYRAFLRRFPTPASCAREPVGEVVRAWSGLGYNRRAVHLHAAAGKVVGEHGGTVPCDLGALESLPGVGPYTARAVLAFAFERDVGVVDVNVARVLARAVIGSALAPAAVQKVADALVPRRRGWVWNQALIEIGAVWCAARSPRCARCPLAATCAWRRAGRAAPDPARPAVRQPRFAGSDRQGRGRLVEALRAGPVPAAGLPAACGWPGDPERAGRVADALMREGIVHRARGGTLELR